MNLTSRVFAKIIVFPLYVIAALAWIADFFCRGVYFRRSLARWLITDGWVDDDGNIYREDK